MPMSVEFPSVGEPYQCQHTSNNSNINDGENEDDGTVRSQDMGAKHSKDSLNKHRGVKVKSHRRLGSKSLHAIPSQDRAECERTIKETVVSELDNFDTLSLSNNNNNESRELPLEAGVSLWDHKLLSVIKLKAYMDKKLTMVDESSPGVLKYKTPHFRSQVTVEIPRLVDGERLQVGWIQTCVAMQFVNTYGEEGVTSWEFPEIASGKYLMISDADGKMYPWYGAKKELKTLKGPCESQYVTVEMNDNFFPQVTWHIPDESYDRKPRLTHVHRKQRFYTCLAVKDLVQNRVYIYRTITWSMELDIDVDPSKPLGERAKLIGPLEQEAPKVLKKNIQLPVYALKPPNANRSQALIWRPRKGSAKVVVQPLETTIDITEYLNSSRHSKDKIRSQMD